MSVTQNGKTCTVQIPADAKPRDVFKITVDAKPDNTMRMQIPQGAEVPHTVAVSHFWVRTETDPKM